MSTAFSSFFNSTSPQWVARGVLPLFGPASKLACLWFDELYVEEMGGGTPTDTWLEKAVTLGVVTRRGAETLRSTWRPCVIPPREHGPLWLEAQSASERLFVKSVNEVLLELTTHMSELEEYPAGGGLFRPPAVIRANLGDRYIQVLSNWWQLNELEGCSLLPDSPERAMLTRAMNRMQPDPDFDVFTQVIEYAVPDLAEIGWDRILELRQHPHVEEFRAKVHQLARSAWKNETRLIPDIVDEIERRDLRALARVCTPAPRSTILKGIASNLPLPIPINPFSLAVSLNEVRHARDVQRRFGWLYFFLDLTDVRGREPGGA